MAASDIILAESFGWTQTLADLSTYGGWTAGGVNALVVGTGPRSNNFLRVTPGSSAGLSNPLPTTDVWVACGFRFRAVTLPGGSNTVHICTLKKGGAWACALGLTPTGQLVVIYQYNTTRATSAAVITANSWQYVEFLFQVTTGASAAYTVKVDGATVLNGTTTLSPYAIADVICFGSQYQYGGGANPTYQEYCDVVVQQAAGASFLGDVAVEWLSANANGNSSQLTGSDADSTNNYLHVDDSTSIDGDTSYVESAVSGNKDTYGVANPSSTPGTIHAVIPTIRARKTDAGPMNVVPVVRSGGADYDQTAEALGDSYAAKKVLLTTDPATGSAWTASAVNNMEVGLKVP